MSKISIIIKREYLSRVKRRSFILSTFLFPIFILVFIVGSVLIALKSKEVVRVAVPNDNFFRSSLKSDSSSAIFQVDSTVTQSNFDEKGYTAFIRPARDTIFIISRKQLGPESVDQIENQLHKAYENSLLEEKGIKKTVLDSVAKVSEKAFEVSNKLVNAAGAEKESNARLASAVGFASGILIYITMFVFGAMVMRGVMEEKMNRIAEVIVSSVKPFQLMMGKIVGIAAVGLTQFLMWIILIIILSSALQLFLPPETLHHMQDVQQNPAVGQNATLAANLMNAKAKIIGGAQWSIIIPSFFFYFLGGYLFYAALFASIGSVVNEDPQEAQSLVLPITMPIIFSFLILTTTISHPNSPMAFWASIIPFSSPIVMMGRIAYGVPEGVPWWQLFLSMALLIGGFVGTTWFAGKIYRTGILLYGKRVTWREMIKWLRRSS